MASANQGTFRRGVERIFNQGSLTGMGEGQLLRQYAIEGDEAAFEALVTRHGPMVLSVCRRMLYDPRDVEDAFQATFLVLLRRAGSLGSTDPLSPWLHGVAYRVAARIRANSARRRSEERAAARSEALEFACNVEQHELKGILDEEIHRLPEKYRRPVVLCYMEGQTQEEAARRLRCTAGSVRGRLDRAREKLRGRLVRRGVAPAAGLIVTALSAETAASAVPPRLIGATVSTLGRAETARAIATTGVRTVVRELADGLIRTMILAKLKLAGSVVAGTAILALGLVMVANLPRSEARDGQEAHAGAAPQQRNTTETSNIPKSRRAVSSIDLRVEDHRARKPLGGVAVTINVDRKDIGRATTDNAGRAAIPVPSPVPSFLAVTGRKDGFATMTAFIRDPRLQPGDIPATFTLAMHPVETVTGVVRDEQGRPVEGVLVEPVTLMREGGGGIDRDEFECPPSVRTDVQGRWRCDRMPAGIDSSRIAFRFSHADFQPVFLPSGTALEHIGRGEATVLPRGLEISGRVVDRTGAPIGGAHVFNGETRFGMGVQPIDSDADGRFRFAHVPGGETVLTVQAPGHAPDLRKVVVAAALAPIEFRLEPGRTIQGRVVDARGNPLAEATIVADGWRGHRTLDWSTTSDDEGLFQWTDAPPDAVWIDVMRDGYLRINRREVRASGDELAITMVRELKVRGTVVDAETRHAVPSFTLVPGTESGGNFPTYWDRNRARPLSTGRYEITLDQSSREGYRLRIEADGYMPAISRAIRDDEDEPVVNFVLHKGSGVAGDVRLLDGSPLAGADVVLVTSSQPAFINNGQPPNRDGNRAVKSGADGRFAFPAQEPPYRIVVLHDRGFAEQASDANSSSAVFNLTVRPWGRVEGSLRIGSRPAAGESLTLAYALQGDTPDTRPWWSGEVVCDASGRFVFERVMPGEVSVSRKIQIRPMTTSSSHSVQVDVVAGETARMVIGGTGRPIIGKVTAAGAIADQVDWSYSLNWLHRKQPQAEPPAGLDNDAKQKWHEAWRKSPAGKASRRAQRWYAVKLEPDGSFRTEDVEAGPYELFIRVNERPLDPYKVGLGSNLLGSARRDVTVPEMPDGRSDHPLDLGTISLEPAKKPAE